MRSGKKRTAIAALACASLLHLGGASAAPATDVPAHDVQAVLKQAVESKKSVVDTEIRTVDAGGVNVGIGVVYRTAQGAQTAAAIAHDDITEVYHVMSGSGILVTGGSLIHPKRDDRVDVIHRQNGPSMLGSGIEGGVSRRIASGDIVIIPAGVPHWFSQIDEQITYTIVRIDPKRKLDAR